MKSRHSLDMTSGPITKQLFIYAFPLILRSLVNRLYSTVDKVVAGRCLGSGAMAAVGASGVPISLLSNFILFLSTGVSVTCGNYIGGKKEKELRECIHTALPLGFLGGVLVCVAGLLASEPLLLLMNTPQSIMHDATTYMRVRMLCNPIALFNAFACSIMYAKGDTKAPTFMSIISGFVNVVFDLLFVLGFHMDVAGLAWATFLSYATDTIFLLFILLSPKGGYNIQLSKLRLHKIHLQRILAVGLPAGVNATVFNLSNMILQSSTNSFGEAVVAGDTAASSCYCYVHIVISNFSSACLCATAQCYGAQNFQRIREVIKKSLGSCLGLSLIMAVLITIFVRPLLRLFTDDPAVIEAGIPIVMFNCWGFFVFCFGEIYGAALKGIRKSSNATTVNLLSVCIPRVIWVLAILPLNNTPIMLYCIYPISWLIASIMMGYSFKKHFAKLTLSAV